ncbi:MAG: PRC-barrel domain-containing protein [Thermoplasmata archaeon]
MLEEVSEMIGLQVYTKSGMFLGTVNNVVMDLEDGKVDGIFVGDTNPLLVEDSKSVNVPFRWVNAIGDIVLLRYFPKRVSISHKKKPEEEA